MSSRFLLLPQDSREKLVMTQSLWHNRSTPKIVPSLSSLLICLHLSSSEKGSLFLLLLNLSILQDCYDNRMKQKYWDLLAQTLRKLQASISFLLELSNHDVKTSHMEENSSPFYGSSSPAILCQPAPTANHMNEPSWTFQPSLASAGPDNIAWNKTTSQLR